MSAGTEKSTVSDKVDAAFVARIHRVVELAGGIAALSRKCQLSRAVIHKYLNGESDPSRTRLIALARAAGVSVEWLATGAEDPQPQAAATVNQDETATPPQPSQRQAPSPSAIARRLAALYRQMEWPIAPEVVIDQAFAIHANLELSQPNPDDREKAFDGILAALRAVLPGIGGGSTSLLPEPHEEFRRAVAATIRSLAGQPQDAPHLAEFQYQTFTSDEDRPALRALWTGLIIPHTETRIRHEKRREMGHEDWKKSIIPISDTRRTGGCFGYFLVNLFLNRMPWLPTDFALAILGGGETFCVEDGRLRKGGWRIVNDTIFIAWFDPAEPDDKPFTIFAVCLDDGIFDVKVEFSGRDNAFGHAKSGCLLLDDPKSENSEALRTLDRALAAAGRLVDGFYVPTEPDAKRDAMRDAG